MASIGLSVVTIVFGLVSLRIRSIGKLILLIAFWAAYAAVDLLALGVIG